MSESMTDNEEIAAMQGMAMNLSIPIVDRLRLALQVINRLREREHQLIRTAVADTFGQAYVFRADYLDLRDGEAQVRAWTMEPGSDCPLCMDAECGEGCPLARMREGLE